MTYIMIYYTNDQETQDNGISSGKRKWCW